MSSYTAAASFQLMSLKGMIEALGFFGITWAPEVLDHEAGGDMPPSNQLYAWTTRDSVVLRTGTDTFDQDQARRAHSSLSIDPPPVRSDIRVPGASLCQMRDRGFSLALHSGVVLVDEGPDLQWLLDAGLDRRSVDGIVSGMQEGSWMGGPYGFANDLIVRLSAHLGDMAVPLSPHHVDADLIPRAEPDTMDEAAQRTAQRLLTQPA